jgi:uncharacterized protein YraI
MKCLAAVATALLMALPAVGQVREAYTTTQVNVRAGPAGEYPLVMRLRANTPVTVHGCVDDYRWCDVSVGGDQGWVYAQNLAYPYEQRHVPILGYGAAIGLPIIAFSLGSYWDNHYRQRPWYGQRPRWEQHRPPPRPPVVRPPDYRPPQHRPPNHVRPPPRPQPQPPVVRPQPPRPGGPAPHRPPSGARPSPGQEGGPPLRPGQGGYRGSGHN